jgi:uncharacterized protein
MIECPWCLKKVVIVDDVCPECRHEVLTDLDGNVLFNERDEDSDELGEPDELLEADIHQLIKERFHCAKCKHNDCIIKEVAMTGAGLSKLFDIQHNHYLFVSCDQCGSVEIYDPDVLSSTKSGKLGTIMDILFGG